MVNGNEVAVRCYPMAIRHRDSTQSRERDGGKGSKRTVYRSSWCSHGLFWPLLEKNLCYISLYVFVHNCQQPLNKITGPLTATEISAQRLLWIKWAQQQGPDHKNFHENEQQLNLQKNNFHMTGQLLAIFNLKPSTLMSLPSVQGGKQQ